MNLVSSAHQASPPSASYSHLRTNSATGGSNTNSATLNSLSSSHAGVYASTHSSGIRKKPAHPIKHRSYSSNHGERLHQLALEQAELNQQHEIRTAVTPCAVGSNWLTPQHSPEPSAFLQEPVQFQQYSTWSAPTPPRSDSGLPTLAADIADEQPAVTCAGVSSPGSFAFEQVTASPEMSSLGFLLPSQYANGMYPSEPSTQYNMDPNYVAPLRSQPVTTGQPSYTSTVSSSPSLYQSRAAEGRRDGPPPATTQSLYASSTRRLTGPYDSPISNEYSMPASQSIPSISGLAASPMTNVAPSPYSSTVSRPMYDNASYYSNGAYTQAQPPSQMYAPQGPAYSPYVNNDRMAADARSADAMRQNNNQRPKPQCWDHGCNGRQFSTFSNLLRHQREKSGTAAKSYCPKCGAEFTRTTARNGHVAHDKCTKTSRRQSEDRS